MTKPTITAMNLHEVAAQRKSAFSENTCATCHVDFGTWWKTRFTCNQCDPGGRWDQMNDEWTRYWRGMSREDRCHGQVLLW